MAIEYTDLSLLKTTFSSLNQYAKISATEHVNKLAFVGRKKAMQHIPRKMIVRTPYTIKSVRVNKSKVSRKPVAELGSVLPYMRDQEFGGYVKRSQIPTLAARSGKKTSKIPARLRYKTLKSQLNPRNRSRPLKNKGRVYAALVQSKKRKEPVHATIGKATGYFIIKRKQVRLIHATKKNNTDITKVFIPPTRWLAESTQKTVKDPRTQSTFKKQLLKNMRIFR